MSLYILSEWCCTFICISLHVIFDSVFKRASFGTSMSRNGFSFIRLQQQSALVQLDHQSITNPPLMSLASQQKRWHFALRPSPFPTATHGRTSASRLRWGALLSRPCWDEGPGSDDWWIRWQLNKDYETRVWEQRERGEPTSWVSV